MCTNSHGNDAHAPTVVPRPFFLAPAIASACVIDRARALQGGGDVLLRMRHTHKMATNTSLLVVESIGV